MKQLDNEKLNKGFTLIELLVTTGVLAVLMVGVTGLFISSLRTERSILASKRVLGQVSYAMEYMGRALRMARKDIDGDGINCIPVGSNYQITAQGGIRFINFLQESDCQEFFLEDGQIKFQSNIGSPLPITLALTSPRINVTRLKFNLSGETQGPPDTLQPFITIVLSVYSPDSPVFKIQTSISQRSPDTRR